MLKYRSGTIRRVAFCAVVTIGFMVTGGIAPAVAEEDASDSVKKKPNILLIVADDLGYSEIGAYGGEIRTPNIDALAEKGVKFTDFYVAPSCSPTRSMLLSGTDNHLAGLGSMAEVLYGAIGDLPDLPRAASMLADRQRGKVGYEGYLNERVYSFPTFLQDAGYRTYMAGKWHLGEERDQWPDHRGFDKFFTAVDGAATHFNDAVKPLPPREKATYVDSGEVVTLPDDFYTTTSIVDHMIGWMEEDRTQNADKPFFAYFASTAPHDPLQVPDEYLDLYAGQYDEGYDVYKERRLARMKELGLVDQSSQGAARFSRVPAWDSLPEAEKKRLARSKEIYAAMVQVLDNQVGRLIGYLEETGKLDNTVIIFISDNGASHGTMKTLGWTDEDFDNSPENMGRINSTVSYEGGWAHAGSVPFNMFKGTTAEGGIRSPMIVTGPGIARTGISHAFAHVMDLGPTILDLAGVVPEQKGEMRLPMTGKSLLPVLLNQESDVRGPDDVVGWELMGGKALRKGDWKIVFSPPLTGLSWKLFNLADDPSEMHDLSEAEPEKMKEMMAEWQKYVEENNVVTFSWTQEMMMKMAFSFMQFKERFFK